MRVEIFEKQIICRIGEGEMTDGERQFLHDTYFDFVKTSTTSDYYVLNHGFKCTARYLRQVLYRIFLYAKTYGIEVDESVQTFFDIDLKEAERLEAEEWERQHQEEIRKWTWERKKKDGCLGCQNCKVVGDDNESVCAATGDDLEQRNCPEYDYKNMVYRVFNLKPFPSEKCPYRV